MQRYYERYKIHDSARGSIEHKIRKTLRDAEEASLRWKVSHDLGVEREQDRIAKARHWELAKEVKDNLLSKLAKFEALAKNLDRARSLRRFMTEIESNTSVQPELRESLELMALMANWLDPLVAAPWPEVDDIGEKNPYGGVW